MTSIDRDPVRCLNCSEEAAVSTAEGPMCDECAALLAESVEREEIDR